MLGDGVLPNTHIDLWLAVKQAKNIRRIAHIRIYSHMYANAINNGGIFEYDVAGNDKADTYAKRAAFQNGPDENLVLGATSYNHLGFLRLRSDVQIILERELQQPVTPNTPEEASDFRPMRLGINNTGENSRLPASTSSQINQDELYDDALARCVVRDRPDPYILHFGEDQPLALASRFWNTDQIFVKAFVD